MRSKNDTIAVIASTEFHNLPLSYAPSLKFVIFQQHPIHPPGFTLRTKECLFISIGTGYLLYISILQDQRQLLLLTLTCSGTSFYCF